MIALHRSDVQGGAEMPSVIRLDIPSSKRKSRHALQHTRFAFKNSGTS